MDKKTEALKLALEALNELIPDVHDWYGAKVHRANAAITAIREALAEQPAQQQQEPVAWMVDVDLANYQGQSEYRTILAWNAKPVHSGTYEINEVLKAVPLYKSPPNVPTARASKPWVGLTDISELVEAELTHYWNGEYADTTGARDQLTDFARAIEAKLREKNQ